MVPGYSEVEENEIVNALGRRGSRPFLRHSKAIRLKINELLKTVDTAESYSYLHIRQNEILTRDKMQISLLSLS